MGSEFEEALRSQLKDHEIVIGEIRLSWFRRLVVSAFHVGNEGYVKIVLEKNGQLEKSLAIPVLHMAELLGLLPSATKAAGGYRGDQDGKSRRRG